MTKRKRNESSSRPEDDEKELEEKEPDPSYTSSSSNDSSDDSSEDTESDTSDLEDESSSEEEEENDEHVPPALYVDDDGNSFTEEQIDAMSSASVSIVSSEYNSLANSINLGPFTPGSASSDGEFMFERTLFGTIRRRDTNPGDNEEQPLLVDLTFIEHPPVDLSDQEAPTTPELQRNHTNPILMAPRRATRTINPSTIIPIPLLFSQLSDLQPNIMEDQRFNVLSLVGERMFQNLASRQITSGTSLLTRELLDHIRQTTRRFEESAPSVVRNGHSYSEDEYELAANYFNSMKYLDEEDNEDDEQDEPEDVTWIQPCANVLNVMLEYWDTHARQCFPNMDELVVIILNEVLEYAVMNISIEDLSGIIQHYIPTLGYLPSTTYLDTIFEYFLIHGEYPTPDELNATIRRTMSFFSNSQAYHQSDKVIVPTQHIDRLPKYSNSNPTAFCGICQDTIQLSQQVIKLTPCGHEFHATASDCLQSEEDSQPTTDENGSIIKWLNNSNKCPMCKTQVSAPEK